jgi:hypothetical protein
MNITERQMIIGGIVLISVGTILGLVSPILFALASGFYGAEQTALIGGGVILIVTGIIMIIKGIVFITLRRKLVDIHIRSTKCFEITANGLKIMGITFISISPIIIISGILLLILAQSYTGHEFVGLVVGAAILFTIAVAFQVGALISFTRSHDKRALGAV